MGSVPAVVFKNPGTIDPASITTFGVSVKESENPIGFFGTGLKYAIAIYLRLGCQVDIWSGYSSYSFSVKKKEIRGKHFDIVTMNGEEVPFTTELGKTWEPWQAFRELYCNCLDEKGAVSLVDFDEIGTPDGRDTLVVVRGSEAVLSFHERDSIVLPRRDNLLLAKDECEIYDTPSDALFYRGVRVSKLPKKSMFTYNLVRAVDLTEDRTLKHAGSLIPMIHIYAAGITNKTAVKRLLNATDEFWEHTFSFSWIDIYSEKLSPAFLEVLEESYVSNSDRTNKFAMQFYRKYKDKQSLKNYAIADTTTIEEAQLEKCKKICRGVFHDFDNYKIIVVKSLGSSCMALADTELDTMVFSKDCFTRGTKYLLATMIEEYAHLKTGYNDCTREFQTYLFDTIASLIEEHVVKEPI